MVEYHICFGTDAFYLPQTAVMIHSIVTGAARSKISHESEKFVFHILADSFSSENKSQLANLGDYVSAIFPSLIICHDTDTEDFKELHGWTDKNSRSIYLRFLIPYFIKDDADKVLYLDADMICLGDIRELFNIDLEGQTVGAVADALSFHAVNGRLKLKSKHIWGRTVRKKYGEGETYFNSGVLLIDLERWRKLRVSEQCMDILKHYDTTMPDQDALNLCLKGNVKFLSARWNLMWPITFKEAESKLIKALSNLNQSIEDQILPYARGQKKAVLLHFAGFVKPWQGGRFVIDGGEPSVSLMQTKMKYLEYASSIPVFGWHFRQLKENCDILDPTLVSIELGKAISLWLQHDCFSKFDKGLRRGIRQKNLIKGLMLLQIVQLIALGIIFCVM